MLGQHENESGINLKLMERANPLLFSQERIDEYPLKYDELKQYLNAKDSNGSFLPLHQENMMHTEGDYLDFLLYRKNDNDTSIDLNKKLACEFALYQVQKQKRQGGLPKELSVSVDKLMKLKPQSQDWNEQMMSILESINAIELDTSVLKPNGGDLGNSMLIGKEGTHMNGFASKNVSVSNLLHNGEKSLSPDDIPDNRNPDVIIQELTSYLLSNAITKGIVVKPERVDDPVEFLKSSIDSIINESSQNERLITEARKQSIKRSNTYKNSKELEIAFKDLQLAHNFLTKQFENDREEYSRDIEKLTSNNNELQQKVLNYHSSLLTAENTMDELEKKLKEEKLKNTHTEQIFSPVTPMSASSNNSQSITIMRNEFKKMLSDTQKRYEQELEEERQARFRLEKELESLKNR
ncbi:hypothetical protein Kpol_526p27 [Vanderwaltozyma polyspora DSM 70294]|uniref:Uncharacterized protein n=1 Tax=Vanderwaltozyma polyspora (strain ATCC 22028 / DSM 70294 / BCRC 21397 / CBS 2163 / NBRC 10782 / NRRL Y-8283 / UCD 57-17) TaxID=436907 RepID=A7TLT2_VANPO|nr:uncharacterized protein Kpol_526p27 [Vanderwaltozyma polyspora DSM 70294]EDO16774.1 hypothetical protein Kpol_526p27 [Vanderwaltozyma polyspora DSM 70294]